MAPGFTLYSVPPLAAALISLVLIRQAWANRDRSIAMPFIALMTAVGVWSFAYGMQLNFTDLSGQLFWRRIAGTAAIAAPTIWVVLTAEYAGKHDWLTRRSLTILSLFPLSYAALLWTTQFHGLVWSDAALVGTDPPLLELALGPAYFGYVFAGYLLVIVGIAQLLRVFLNSSPIYRRQAGLLVAGATIPLLANVAFIVGTDPIPELDLTTFAFTITGVVFGAALFQFDLLDLTPVARRQLIDELGIGCLVVNADGRVVHYNDIARQVLPSRISTGIDATTLFSVEQIADVDGLISEITIDGQRRFYDFQVSPLYGRQDHLAGRLIGIRDVTERREYEQRLEVTNRVLRHNLRNEMNKILGWVDVVEQSVGLDDETMGAEFDDAAGSRFDDGADAAFDDQVTPTFDDDRVSDALDRVRSVATHVSQLSEQAEKIQTTLDRYGDDLVAVDAAELLSSIVLDMRAGWPDATVTLSAPDRLEVLAPNETLLETVCRNLVENALEHNDADEPHVEITLQCVHDSRTVELRVADNGPGIPEIERETLLRGAETPLQHGSGLGLWLVNWIVGAAGGDLEFRENDPHGSVVIVRLDPATIPDSAD